LIRSKGVFAYFHFGLRGANARATITFALVYAFCPFGKPRGMRYPLARKYGWVLSRPSSMIPIFTPFPAEFRVGPQSAGAPMKAGVDERSVW
jgi:hypothetical protein